jgi:nucleosome binding factor SPN SPT16 subunit
LILNRGPLNEEEVYVKSGLLHQWLFGYELPDTVLLLRKDGHVWFLATKKKCEFLQEAAKNISERSHVKEIHFLQRNKEDGNAANYDTLWKEALAARVNGEKRAIGLLLKERQENAAGGGIVGAWEQRLTAEGEKQSDDLTFVDVANGLSFAMSVKDPEELDLMKKSSVFSNKVMKHGLVKRMEEVIDSEESITHQQLAAYVEDILEDPSKIKLNVPSEEVSSCYNPIIQSGGKYDLRVSAQSSTAKLSHDVIIASLGARYKSYCSNIARTFFVDPPKKVSSTYDALLEMQEACLAAMKPGNQLKAVYKAAVKFLQERKGSEYLVGHLPKNLGFCMGLDFRESAMLLSPKNQAAFKRGMVFCLSVGFQDLELSESDRSSTPEKSPVKKLSTYALQVADMVAIMDDSPDVLTKFDKNLTNVAYNINEDEGGDDEEESEDESVDAPDAPEGDEEFARKVSQEAGGRKSSRLAKEAAQQEAASEGVAEREKRQIELMTRRNEERIRELARSNRNKGDSEEQDEVEELETYKRTRDYPDNIQPNQVKVDMANHCVILPICGNPVPFHISTIKNVVMPEGDSATLLRINFYTAGMALGKDAPANMAKLVAKYAPYASFIREMTFRSLDGHSLTLVSRWCRCILSCASRFFLT